MAGRAIDVSTYNGDFNWYSFEGRINRAIIKVINKQLDKDKRFEQNYTGAVSIGVPVDVYNYVYCKSVEEAAAAANAVINMLKGKSIGYVWYDFEDAGTFGNMNVAKCSEIMGAYRSVIEAAGYKFGIYANRSFIEKLNNIGNNKIWFARYPYTKVFNFNNDEPELDMKKYVLDYAGLKEEQIFAWQYTSNFEVAGVKFDMSYLYGEQNISGKNENDFPLKNVKLLKCGAKSEFVGVLQRLLNSLEIVPLLVVDNIFGIKTRVNVFEYQKLRLLKEDGIVGPKTLAQLKLDWLAL